MSVRHQVLIHGLLVFVLTGALALAAGMKAVSKGGYVPSDAVAIPYFLAIFLFATLLLLLMLRFIKRPEVFEGLFAATVLAGAWFLADAFLPPGAALLAGSLVIVLRFAWKNALTANMSLILGVSGLAASLGADIRPNAALILLTLLSFYDIVAVYRTKHMVTMFRGLAARGALFAFVLGPAEKKVLLGTGDVALPAILSVSALQIGVAQAVSVLIGACLGFLLMIRIHSRQTEPAPVPALPPIALGSILGYLVSFLIFHP